MIAIYQLAGLASGHDLPDLSRLGAVDHPAFKNCAKAENFRAHIHFEQLAAALDIESWETQDYAGLLGHGAGFDVELSRNEIRHGFTAEAHGLYADDPAADQAQVQTVKSLVAGFNRRAHCIGKRAFLSHGRLPRIDLAH